MIWRKPSALQRILFDDLFQGGMYNFLPHVTYEGGDELQPSICRYSHDYVLSPEQIACLASNAKKAPCNWLKNGESENLQSPWVCLKTLPPRRTVPVRGKMLLGSCLPQWLEMFSSQQRQVLVQGWWVLKYLHQRISLRYKQRECIQTYSHKEVWAWWGEVLTVVWAPAWMALYLGQM